MDMIFDFSAKIGLLGPFLPKKVKFFIKFQGCNFTNFAYSILGVFPAKSDPKGTLLAGKLYMQW